MLTQKNPNEVASTQTQLCKNAHTKTDIVKYDPKIRLFLPRFALKMSVQRPVLLRTTSKTKASLRMGIQHH